MLTIEQIREMTEACAGLTYVSSYNYEAHRGKVERVLNALRAMCEFVYVPSDLENAIDAVGMLRELTKYAAKRGKPLSDATSDAHHEASIAAAQQARDWWRGEGAYEVPDEDDVESAATEAPEPVTTAVES